MLGALGSKVDNLALKWVHSGEHRSPFFARWAERIWAKPLLFGVPALLVLLALAAPVMGLKTGMPSIKVVPASDTSRIGYTQVQAAFGPGAPGALQLVAPIADAAALEATAQADRGIANVMPAQTSTDGRYALVQAIPKQNPSDPAVGATIDRLRVDAAGHRARRRRGGGEPRPRDRPRRRHAARDRRRARARLPAAARRAAGADHRPRRRAHEPARDRRRLRCRPPRVPGGQPDGHPRLRVAGLPRRVGPGVLLRDDLRDLDGLHRVPAGLGQGAPRAQRRRRQGGHDRRPRTLRPRHPRGRRGDGRGVLHLRHLRARCRRRRWASSSASRSPSTRSSCGCC